MNDKFKKVVNLVLIIAFVETLSLICLKEGETKNKNHFVLCGFLGYVLVTYILCQTLTFEGIGQVNLIWNCMTIFTAFAAGHLLFNEKVNKYTFYAIIFAVIAIYLAQLSSDYNENN
uniref:EamA domain-containing protein n=1 Tax=viral metagenome TaxID=1070528 RepID=A0A6C0DK57_9ZZZZ